MNSSIDDFQQLETRQAPCDETATLIASDKVEGTKVFDVDGRKLGRIENFMVGKRTGRVEYAVMSFGGILGIGEKYYPLPWDQLRYDEDLNGYVVDMDKGRLENAPWFDKTDPSPFAERRVMDIRSFYSAPL